MTRYSFAAASKPLKKHSPKIGIGIIGGGMAGSFSVIAQLDRIERFLETASKEEIAAAPSIDISIFNVLGDPYDHKDYVFFLNQPAGNMSIFPDRPDDFKNWIDDRRQCYIFAREDLIRRRYDDLHQGKNYSAEKIALEYPDIFLDYILLDADADSYMPRALYGQYMNERLQDACHSVRHLNETFARHRSAARISVHHHNEYVERFEKEGAGFRVFGKNPETGMPASSIYIDCHVIATGHVESDLLKELQGVKGYGDTPFTVREIEGAAENAEESGLPLLLAGTGQAALDALGALAAMDYKGQVIAVSGEVVEPWPKDHKLSRAQVENFTYVTDLIDTLHKCVIGKVSADEAYLRFSASLQETIHCKPLIAIGPAHLIRGLIKAREDISNACAGYGNDFADRLIRLVESHDGNSTAPVKYAMYCGFKDRGQLTLKAGRVAACRNEPGENFNRFHVTVADPRMKESFETEVGGILNSASMSRAALDRQGNALHPLIGNLMRLGVLKPCPLAPGAVTPVDPSRTIMVGVSDGEGPFGVPYNRDEIWYKNLQLTEGVLFGPAPDRASGARPEPSL